MTQARDLADIIAGANTLPSASMPSGTIIQTIQNTSTAQFRPTSGGGSWQDSGYNITITPTNASNKILISFSSWGIMRGPIVTGIKLERGSTEVWSGDGFSNDGTNWQTVNYGFSYLDSPATTSATTYTIYMWAGTLTIAQEMRMAYNGGTTGNDPKAVLIAQEIAG